MSLLKPAAVLMCVALAGCAGKADSDVAAGAGQARPEAPQVAAKASKGDAKPAPAAAGKTAAATPPAAEKKGGWWWFSGADEAAQPAKAQAKAAKVEAPKPRKVDAAWLDAAEKRLRDAVAGSKFRVERRGEVLVVVAPVDGSFNPDRPAMLLPATLRPLSQVAKLAASDPDSAVLILGHADSSGDVVGNRKLSLERAQSMAAIFRLSGLQSDRLALHGAGSDLPLASNQHAAGRAQNRRVEMMLTLRSGLPALVAQNNR